MGSGSTLGWCFNAGSYTFADPKPYKLLFAISEKLRTRCSKPARDIVSSAIEPVPEINLATDLAADCMVTRVAIC